MSWIQGHFFGRRHHFQRQIMPRVCLSIRIQGFVRTNGKNNEDLTRAECVFARLSQPRGAYRIQDCLGVSVLRMCLVEPGSEGKHQYHDPLHSLPRGAHLLRAFGVLAAHLVAPSVRKRHTKSDEFVAR